MITIKSVIFSVVRPFGIKLSGGASKEETALQAVYPDLDRAKLKKLAEFAAKLSDSGKQALY